ncbi:hypothetical protein M0802_004306 [Mischocyttarus mexicanus]|nr:hypothetical protein M0802_004306 [Mischocyttarus mexicanus]
MDDDVGQEIQSSPILIASSYYHCNFLFTLRAMGLSEWAFSVLASASRSVKQPAGGSSDRIVILEQSESFSNASPVIPFPTLGLEVRISSSSMKSFALELATNLLVNNVHYAQRLKPGLSIVLQELAKMAGRKHDGLGLVYPSNDVKSVLAWSSDKPPKPLQCCFQRRIRLRYGRVVAAIRS